MEIIKSKYTLEELKKHGILPEAAQTVVDAQSWLYENPKMTSQPYGHSIGILAQIIVNGEDVPYEEQREELKKNARILIEKYGDHIIDFMRPELREALDLNK